jgi:hypothetical protein
LKFLDYKLEKANNQAKISGNIALPGRRSKKGLKQSKVKPRMILLMLRSKELEPRKEVSIRIILFGLAWELKKS